MPEPVLNDRERVLADNSRCRPRTERSTSARGTSPRSLLTSGKSGKRRLSLVVTHLIVKGITRLKMSDTGLTVPGMTGPLSRYDVTITVDRDGSDNPNPAEFAMAAEQAASARTA